jgi:hypothetical protein
MTDTISLVHPMICPMCASSFSLRASGPRPPPDQPCGACWQRLSPESRAPWLRVLRATSALQAALGHRDPARYAPPTLVAYVAHLEARLAETEAVLEVHQTRASA